MNPTNVSATSATRLRTAIGATRQLLTELPFEACDTADLEELLGWAERELAKPLPSASTLAVPLNSVARSLAAKPESRHATLLWMRQCERPVSRHPGNIDTSR